MDRRQQKTRTAIFNAFSSLLAKKSYNRITVQEIIDTANIGRSTFYAHFETKDQLLKEMCTDLFEHVFSDTLVSESTHDFSLAIGNSNTLITHILYHLRDNQKNIIGILSCESRELFLQFFREYLYELITTKILQDSEEINHQVPQDFLINHISCSFIGMIQWWIKEDLKHTPEELTQFFTTIISPIANTKII